MVFHQIPSIGKRIEILCMFPCNDSPCLCVIVCFFISTDRHVTQWLNLYHSLPWRFLINEKTPCKMLHLWDILYLSFIVTVYGLRITPSFCLECPCLKSCSILSLNYSPFQSSYSLFPKSVLKCICLPDLCKHVRACVLQQLDLNIKHLTWTYSPCHLMLLQKQHIVASGATPVQHSNRETLISIGLLHHLPHVSLSLPPIYMFTDIPPHSCFSKGVLEGFGKGNLW